MFAYCDNNPVNNSDSSGFLKISSIFNGIAKGLRVSMMMLKQAFTGKGVKQSYDETSIVSNTLSKSVILQEEINRNIEDCKNSNKTQTTYQGSVSLYGKENMYDVDLSYSVGKASYTMNVSQESKTTGFWFFEKTKSRYVVDITVSDIYDFDEYREGFSIGNKLNNWGYDMQKNGSLCPFEWDANFTYYSDWS